MKIMNWRTEVIKPEKKCILYGAGRLGRRIQRILKDRVAFFCDSYMSADAKVEGIQVIGFSKLVELCDKYIVIVSVADKAMSHEIESMLKESGVDYITVNQALEIGYIDAGQFKYESEFDYWEDRYGTEDGLFSNSHYKDLMLSIAEENDDEFLKDRVVVDFGCGPRGSLAWTNAPAIKIGVDVLASRYAEHFGKNLTKHNMLYITSSENCIPIPDSYADCIMTINSLDHVKNLDIMCKEIVRCLKKGGVLLGSFNLNEAKSACEPQTLTESLLKEKLFVYFDIISYRIAKQGEGNKQFDNMVNSRFAEGDDKLSPCFLWVRAIKK